MRSIKIPDASGIVTEFSFKHSEGATMKAMTTGASCLCLAGVLFIFGCNSQPPSNQAADEAAVRQTDDNWSKAAQSKKVDDWVAYYSDDAVVLPPNEAKTTGKDGIRKEIGALLGMPGLSLSWSPEKVEVSRSGDLAYTQGAYQLSGTDAKGKPMTDHGKTLEIWKKQADGSWKCIADMWSSNLPPTA
jgi:ketosteroid isomerase-like protein